ncbi:antibiotic biosynthesis monooxygenase family protein [Kiloniella majae]|uniref:antibiotic biosynthesis monooxygenase family protein n=1 Tax=Kiloniella majae TaxID=1938558 RepID=UPI000A278B21|nr:antibiotic biosynthesis monooxygenase [Kiloniella majae]
MIAVIFEVIPAEGQKDHYLSLAADLKDKLVDVDGFISIERFQSLVDERKILSLSFGRDEDAVMTWRNSFDHRQTQRKGREGVFSDYRLRVAIVDRDYGMSIRDQAPKDSKALFS